MSKPKNPESFKEVYVPSHWKRESGYKDPTDRKKADPNDPIFDHIAFMQNYPFDYIAGEGLDNNEED